MISKKKTTQLVTAANNEEMLQIGLKNGADAVYLPLSGKLSIRLKRDFFSLSQLKGLIDYTHQQKKLAYVVINGIIQEGEFNNYRSIAQKLFTYGADGLVLGSISLAKWIAVNLKPQNPGFKIIASGAMSAMSSRDADFLYRIGIDRVIIPRLHNMTQIEYYRAKTKGELEIFVHGLFCPSWEGQTCLMPMYHHPDELLEGCCLPGNTMDLQASPCLQYRDEEQNPIWGFKVQADLAYLSQLVGLGIDSVKVIPVGNEPQKLAQTIATWRNALDLAESGNPLPLEKMRQILTQASPLPLDFHARTGINPCKR